MSYDRVWLDNIFHLMDRCANHLDCHPDKPCAKVVVTPDGCAAILEERKEMKDEIARLRAVVVESRRAQ
jgi:hypothetical protein